jgi:hypothetical protein
MQKSTKDFNEFCDEVLHAISLSHDRHVKKQSKGEDDSCDCNLCQAVFEIDSKETKGPYTYKNYADVFYAFMEFPCYGFKNEQCNTAMDYEEFGEQVESHVLFMGEIKKIILRHIKSRI